MSNLRTFEVTYTDSRCYSFGNRSITVIAADEDEALDKAMDDDYYFGSALDISDWGPAE